MKRPSRFTLVFITVMLVYVFGYILHVTINPKYPFEADMPNYAIALAQAEHPEFYASDPVFQDGRITKMLWSSSYAYMRLFQGLYHLTQENISATLALLQLIPAFTLFLTFYWLLRAFPLDRWLCLMFSVAFSYWMILSRYEGIPSVFYYACIPAFLRILWQYLAEPSLADRPVALWQAVLIGIVIGLSPTLINSVNGLAFSALTLCLMTALFLARRMRWKPYVALLIGLIPCLALAALGGAGGANALQDKAAADALFSNLPTGTLGMYLRPGIFGPNIIEIFEVHTSWMFYFPVLAAVAVLSVVLRYTQNPTRALKMIYLSANALLWWSVLGNIGIVLYLYFLSRFWSQRETKVDYILITGMSAGVFIGPILLWVLILLWKLIAWYPLVFIMWQMFRFQLLTYFIAAVALVFMIEHLTARIGNPSTRRLMQVAFILALGVQSVNAPTLSVEFFVLLGMVLIFIRLSSSSKLYFTRPLVSVKSGAALLKFGVVTVGGLAAMLLLAFWVSWGARWDSSVPLDLNTFIAMSQRIQSYQKTMQADYMDMTDWLRLNTPLDSLIHFDFKFDDRNGFFRYLTQRAMFYTWMDEYLGQYSAGMAANHRDLLRELKATPSILLFGRLIVRYGIDYVVLQKQDRPPLPIWNEGGWYVSIHTYSNTTYDIYRIEKISIEKLMSMLLASGSPA